jgi:hypothetical protein
MQKNYVKIWENDYGSYEIPVEFNDVVFTLNGLPDMRYKRAKDFLNWSLKLLEAEKIKFSYRRS